MLTNNFTARYRHPFLSSIELGFFSYQSNATDSWNLMALHFMRHFTDTMNAIKKICYHGVTWNGNADIGRKTISELNNIMYYQLHDMYSW